MLSVFCCIIRWEFKVPASLHHSEDVNKLRTNCSVRRGVKGDGRRKRRNSESVVVRLHPEGVDSGGGEKKNPYQFIKSIAALLSPWQQRWKQSHIGVGGDAHYVCLIPGLPWTRRRARRLRAAETDANPVYSQVHMSRYTRNIFMSSDLHKLKTQNLTETPQKGRCSEKQTEKLKSIYKRQKLDKLTWNELNHQPQMWSFNSFVFFYFLYIFSVSTFIFIILQFYSPFLSFEMVQILSVTRRT